VHSIQLKDDKVINATRVYGGMCSAGEGPGYGIVIAEEQYEAVPAQWPKTPVMGKRYRLVDEVSTWNVDELIEQCRRFEGRFGAQFYGRNSFRGLEEYLNIFRRRGAQFILAEAPSTNDEGHIRFHINILQDVLLKGLLDRSDLEGSILHHNLHKIKETETAKATDIKFPTIAAAGYALTALEVLQGYEEEQRLAELFWEEVYGEWDD
jgi:hypothetical protein